MARPYRLTRCCYCHREIGQAPFKRTQHPLFPVQLAHVRCPKVAPKPSTVQPAG